jgi:hypothetical protein
MYIPANLLRTLTTPESLAYEVQRRKLKAALSDAAFAVKSHIAPKLGLGLTPKELKTYARNDNGINARLPQYRKDSPERKRYNESVAYYTAIVTHRAEHQELKQAEADARQTYHAFITPSDLE